MIISVGKLCLLILAFATLSAAVGQLNVDYKWKKLEYAPSRGYARRLGQNPNRFDSQKMYIHDVQPLRDGRVLVTLPKRYHDNPASLAIFTREEDNASPSLSAYPRWALHTERNCAGIISINRVALDDYDTLWGIDTGIIAGRQVCGAALYGFDTRNDSITTAMFIPNSISRGGTLEIYAVETRGSTSALNSTTLYISDITRNGFIVWDGSKFFRQTDDRFYGHRRDPVISVGGYDLDTNRYGRGISIIALPPRGIFNDNLIVFKSLTTNRRFFAPRSQMTDPGVRRIGFYEIDIFPKVNELIAVPSADGILFGGVAAPETIICWNMLNPRFPNYTHLWERDEENLQFTSSIKFIQGQFGEEMWVVTNRMTKFLAGAMDFEDYNFRILRANVHDLIADTICDPKFSVRPRNVTTPGGIEDDAIHAGFHRDL